MSDGARRGYLRLAGLFLVVGGAFTALALLQRLGIVDLFQGDPLGVALVVLVIGGLLRWTALTAAPLPDDEPAAGAAEAPEAEVPAADADGRESDASAGAERPGAGER